MLLVMWLCPRGAGKIVPHDAPQTRIHPAGAPPQGDDRRTLLLEFRIKPNVAVRQNLRAFVGQTAFEELAQEWVRRAGRTNELPFVPEAVGAHWSRRVQVDVVGLR